MSIDQCLLYYFDIWKRNSHFNHNIFYYITTKKQSGKDAASLERAWGSTGPENIVGIRSELDCFLVVRLRSNVVMRVVLSPSVKIM